MGMWCSGLCGNILALLLCTSKVVCWLVSWEVLGKAELCSNLMQLVFCLSSEEKLIWTETGSAEVLGEMGACTQIRFWNSWFCCVLLHLVKQQCRKYIHSDVFAWLTNQLQHQGCLKPVCISHWAWGNCVWMSRSWKLSLSVRQLLPRERDLLSKNTLEANKKKDLVSEDSDL